MQKQAGKLAKIILDSGFVKVVSHIDADGISAGSIAVIALERAGIEHEILFVKQLDNEVLDKLRADKPELCWFTDLGTGMGTHMSGINAVITDHHLPDKNSGKGLWSFHKPNQLNPHDFDMDGDVELSGSGATYLVAREMGKLARDQDTKQGGSQSTKKSGGQDVNIQTPSDNTDLAQLAVVGAVGDLQDRRARALTGMNKEIALEGEKAGVVKALDDIFLFGRETRALYKLLQYASDPELPGLTGDRNASTSFLEGIGLKLSSGEKWKTWVQLSDAERKRLASALVKHVMATTGDKEKAMAIFGEVYVFPKEEEGTELHDAKEFSTMLNSCGRYGKAEIGMRLCMGDRDEALKEAKNMLTGHRQNLVSCLNWIKEEGVVEMKHLRWFHGMDRVQDSVVGTVANMLLGSKEFKDDKCMFGFANDLDTGMVKVSGRANRRLVSKGVDLSVLIGKVAGELGGHGGGHAVAAGGHIPEGKEQEFVKRMDELLGASL